MPTVQGPITLGKDSSLEDQDKIIEHIKPGDISKDLYNRGSELKEVKIKMKYDYKCINCKWKDDSEEIIKFCPICGDSVKELSERPKGAAGPVRKEQGQDPCF